MSAADIRGWASAVGDFAREEPRRLAAVVDDAVTASLYADTGDGSFSRGRDLGRATTRITTGDGEAEVAADGSMRVWGILEHGTGGHTVDPGRGRLLRTPFGPRPRVTVSGVRARRTFTEGAQRGLNDAQRQVVRDWQGVFR